MTTEIEPDDELREQVNEALPIHVEQIALRPAYSPESGAAIFVELVPKDMGIKCVYPMSVDGLDKFKDALDKAAKATEDIKKKLITQSI